MPNDVSITLPWKVAGILIWVLLVAILGGVGGDTLSYLRYGDARRPNAFTARDGHLLEQRVERIETDHRVILQRLNQVERTDERLDRRIDALPPQDWRRRIESLEWWILKQDKTYEVPR
jgi:hypothetical protein